MRRQVLRRSGHFWFGVRNWIALCGLFLPAVAIRADEPDQPEVRTPEIAVLSELPTNVFHPFPSHDGLTLYFCHKGPNDQKPWIWTAQRKDADSLFSEPRKLLQGVDHAVTGDGLEMILLSTEGKLQSARRKSMQDAFSRPRLIAEFEGLGFLAGPYLSADGLTLYADHINDQCRFVRFHRATRKDKWSQPTVVEMKETLGANLRFLCVSGDGRLAFCTSKGAPNSAPTNNLLMFTSTDAGESFGSPLALQVSGTVVSGTFPRYVPATRELFFARVTEGKPTEIAVIRDFVPR